MYIISDSNEVPRSINRDWKGVPNGIDAVLLSRLYVPEKKKPALRRSKRRKTNKRKSRKRRPSWTDTFDIVDLFDDYDYDEESDPDWLPPPPKCQPEQSVYFFKNGEYYSRACNKQE